MEINDWSRTIDLAFSIQARAFSTCGLVYVSIAGSVMNLLLLKQYLANYEIHSRTLKHCFLLCLYLFMHYAITCQTGW